MNHASPKVVSRRHFTADDHQTWSLLFTGLEHCRRSMAIPEFNRGIELLGMDDRGIPDLDTVNQKLENLTGWRGVAVEGLEEGESFYPMLAKRTYPVGWFIRDRQDLGYTPAPDVFHDLYGHLPLLTCPAYADFMAEFGRRASPYVNEPDPIMQFNRLFWFTMEFGLLQTENGPRIFGGGILSSRGESNYALSTRPTVIAFDLEDIRRRDYRLDIFQEVLYLIPERQRLYDCLETFEGLLPAKR